MSRAEPMMLPMTVSRLITDPMTNAPQLLLRDETGTETLQLWIGANEARAIAAAIAGIEMQRPMAHDLIKKLIHIFDCCVERVELRDVRGDTCYAALVLKQLDKTVVIDARASDAIAIALRTRAPILVSQRVLGKTRRPARTTRATSPYQNGSDDSTPRGTLGRAAVFGEPARSGLLRKWKM